MSHLKLHASHCTLYTSHRALRAPLLHISSHLIWALPTASQLISSHLAQSKQPRTTSLAQSTYQYYFVLQSSHEALPSTTNLVQSTSQYNFVLQRLHKAPPSTALHYKPCTKYLLVQNLRNIFPRTTLYRKTCTTYFPVLLCTTKIAQSTSQYCFALQTLHKVLASTKLAQHISQDYFVPEDLHNVLPSTTLYYKACAWYFDTGNFLNREALVHTNFIQRTFYTQKFLRTAAFTQRSFTTQETFTHRNFYTEKSLHSEAFTHSKLLHRETFTYTMGAETAAPKLDLGTKATKDDFEAVLKGILKGTWTAASLRKVCWQITSQPSSSSMQPLQYMPSCKKPKYYARSCSTKEHWCSHYSGSAESELQNMKELRPMATEIAAVRRSQRQSEKDDFEAENDRTKIRKSLRNHRRNLDAVTAIGFMMPSGKRP